MAAASPAADLLLVRQESSEAILQRHCLQRPISILLQTICILSFYIDTSLEYSVKFYAEFISQHDTAINRSIAQLALDNPGLKAENGRQPVGCSIPVSTGALLFCTSPGHRCILYEIRILTADLLGSVFHP